jgi:hypothetical protein
MGWESGRAMPPEEVVMAIKYIEGIDLGLNTASL